ncbi:MAG: hypothetical protein M2R45_00837 [Verrucomicrobia subdivision 3 bacterium]|nr:hypothetical protein [Limisphaerales bacterium]
MSDKTDKKGEGTRVWVLLVLLSLVGLVVGIRSCSPDQPKEAAVESVEPEVAVATKPVATDDSAWQKMREQLKITPDKREADWKANFPFKETYHPTLKFDPAAMFDPNDPDTWEGKNFNKFQPLIETHGFMKNFHNNERRFSKGFQDLYHILEEYGRHENPEAMASIFETLHHYHWEASHPPDAVAMRKKYIDEEGKQYNPLTGERLFKMVPITATRNLQGEEIPPLTWGQMAERSARGIVGHLMSDRTWPIKEGMLEEEAIALRDRIIAEIDPADVPGGDAFAYDEQYELELKPGDSLLVPYEGWIEAYWKFMEEKLPPIVEIGRQEQAEMAARAFLDFLKRNPLPPEMARERLRHLENLPNPPTGEGHQAVLEYLRSLGNQPTPTSQ